MKKRFYILSLFTLISCGLFAQTPSNEWAKLIGDTGSEVGKDIVTDANGNVFIVGHFEGTIDADPGTGVSNLTSNGGTDILIVKLNSQGDFVWGNSIGGSGNDAAYGAAISSNGEVYITGYFTGTVDFNPSPSLANTLNSNGLTDIFLLKTQNDGTYSWAKGIGGSSDDISYSIDLDVSNQPVIAGSFSSINTDFNPDVTASLILSPAGGADVFWAYFSANGIFINAKKFGGLSDDVATAVDYNAFGSLGYINLTGYFSGGADFHPDAAINLSGISNGGTDIFVSSFYSNGNYCAHQTIGGQFDDKGYGITTDAQGNVFYTGFFQSTVDFDPSTNTNSFNTNGLADIFVSKLDVNLEHVWTRRIGNSTNDKAFSITHDATDNIYLTGNFQNTLDADPTSNVFELTPFSPTVSGPVPSSEQNIFLLKLTNAGSFEWATYFNENFIFAPISNQANAIHVDSEGTVYTTGYMQKQVDFSTDQSGYNLSSNNNSVDIFVSKISTASTITFTCPSDSNIYMSQNPPVMPDLTSLATASTNCTLNNAVGITQNPVAGSTLVTGANIVTLSFLNDCGDAETCQVTVNYINDLSLTVQCPANQTTTEAVCPDYTSLATVTSVCPAAGVTITQTPAAGTTLTLGATTITLETTNNCGLTSSCTFVVDRTLGINESNMASIAVYPNPTKGFLTIESNQPTMLQLVSVQGQHMRSLQIDGKTTIDVTLLSPGVYLLIREGNQPIRFIKE